MKTLIYSRIVAILCVLLMSITSLSCDDFLSDVKDHTTTQTTSSLDKVDQVLLCSHDWVNETDTATTYHFTADTLVIDSASIDSIKRRIENDRPKIDFSYDVIFYSVYINQEKHLYGIVDNFIIFIDTNINITIWRIDNMSQDCITYLNIKLQQAEKLNKC